MSVYAVMIHWRSAFEKCSAFWIVRSATFVIVASSTTMNWATQTRVSTIQRLTP